jgi:hypothetical protein
VVRFLPFLISLVLSVYALFSCIQTRDKDVPYLPKLVWILLIVFVPIFGPIVWLLLARGYGVPLSRAPAATRSYRPYRPAGRPVAPDDDPEFLASLERYRDPRTTIRPPKPGDPKTPDSAEEQAAGTEADKPEPDQPERSQDESDRTKDRPAKAEQDGTEAGNASDSPTDADGDR